MGDAFTRSPAARAGAGAAAEGAAAAGAAAAGAMAAGTCCVIIGLVCTDNGDQVSHRHFAVLRHYYMQKAACRGLNLIGDLLGLNDQQNFALVDLLAFSFFPLSDLTGFHGKAEFGHGYICCHVH
jgi:hypothetical protein